MGTTSDKFTYLNGTKTAIKDAIVAKGVPVPDGIPFRDYATKIANMPVNPEPYPMAYSQPDWPDIESTCGPNQIKLLVADIPQVNTYFNIPVCEIQIGSSSSVVIDWGDGVVENTSYGLTHEYVRGAGTPCSLGYTTFVITITDTSLGLESFVINFGQLIKVVVGVSTLTTLQGTFYNMGSIYGMLEEIVFKGNLDNVVSADNAFRACANLSRLVLPPMPNCTMFTYAFNTCRKLKRIDGGFDVPAGTNFSNAFANCSSLLTLPDLDFSSATTMVSTFAGNNALLGVLDLSTAINLTKLAITTAFSLSSVLLPVGAPWSGTSPQIDLNANAFDATALNAIFQALPVDTGKTIRITSCVGADFCDTSIATNKGWTVV